MTITFHCQYCGKKVKAPKSTGGKWGKCPLCHNKVYIPDLTSGEELKLVPVNKADEKRKKQLMAETYKLEQNILSQRDAPENAGGLSISASQISDKQLTKNIILYLRRMGDGKLSEAEKTMSSITVCGRRAVNVLDRIALSEIPEPELADIPQQVLSGLIRTLRAKIR